MYLVIALFLFSELLESVRGTLPSPCALLMVLYKFSCTVLLASEDSD